MPTGYNGSDKLSEKNVRLGRECGVIVISFKDRLNGEEISNCEVEYFLVNFTWCNASNLSFVVQSNQKDASKS
jgi:hypothetical protein